MESSGCVHQKKAGNPQNEQSDLSALIDCESILVTIYPPLAEYESDNLVDMAKTYPGENLSSLGVLVCVVPVSCNGPFMSYWSRWWSPRLKICERP